MRLKHLLTKEAQDSPSLHETTRLAPVPDTDHLSDEDLASIVSDFMVEASGTESDQLEKLMYSASDLLEELVRRKHSIGSAMCMIVDQLPFLSSEEDDLISTLYNILGATLQPEDSKHEILRRVIHAGTAIYNNPDVEDTPEVRLHLLNALRSLESTFQVNNQDLSES